MTYVTGHGGEKTFTHLFTVKLNNLGIWMNLQVRPLRKDA